MANLAAVRAALTSSDLRERVEAGCLCAAVDIINESSTITNHQARVDWASRTMANLRFMRCTAERVLLYGIGTNATFNTQGTGLDDTSLQFVINSVVSNPSMLQAVSVSA